MQFDKLLNLSQSITDGLDVLRETYTDYDPDAIAHMLHEIELKCQRLINDIGVQIEYATKLSDEWE